MKTARIKVHDPADNRITARVPSSTRKIIERAAQLYGSTINQFVVQAAVERAGEVLRNMETINLSSDDAATFIRALSNPPALGNELLDAVAAHSRMVESRD